MAPRAMSKINWWRALASHLSAKRPAQSKVIAAVKLAKKLNKQTADKLYKQRQVVIDTADKLSKKRGHAAMATEGEQATPPAPLVFAELQDCKHEVAVHLLQLTYRPEYKKLAIAALRAHAFDMQDEDAAVRRAKIECAKVVGGAGTSVCAKFTLPEDFQKPSEDELKRLLAVAKMPVKPTWDTVPRTKPTQPDRNPRTGFPLVTAAELSAGNGAFLKYAELAGLKVTWFAEI